MTIYKIYATSPNGSVKLMSETESLKMHEAHVLHCLKLIENKIELIFDDYQEPMIIDKITTKAITTITKIYN